ncbi:FAD-dependent oxidoreductase [Microlunatus flavus]|uniref:ferredoxin--NADP(+) reductase n=1 Tax=Microlunatus flavus TaxID=1036181 RepID=A0A1H9D047_9ACTN|nr:FAD-dependent oxidoreductase [Microlunatus flavus]SEQ06872.1 ferredoxin--NADP+ reductase [Microlunatus flavus]
MPLLVAVVGAGPSGVYAAEALTRQSRVEGLGVRVLVLDRLPVPFGLVRYGVAPDHPSIRSIRSTLERTLDAAGVTFYGDVQVGRDLSVDELRASVDAVVYAYGAGSDRRLGIPGEELPGSVAAPELVTWYTGHPDVHPDDGTAAPGHPWVPGLLSAAREVVVVGAGNVALDVVRVLVRGVDELAVTDMAHEVLVALRDRAVTDVHVLARRGPAYTAFTTKELRELGELDDLDLLVDPADLVLDESSRLVAETDRVAARNLAVLAEWAGRPTRGASHRVHLHFWTTPLAVLGTTHVEGVRVTRSAIGPDGLVRATGEPWDLPAQVVVRAVGYRGLRLPGAPYDERTGRIPHSEGRVIRDGAFSPGEYVTGWIKRGPTGVIGTNKSDAVETVASLLDDVEQGTLVPSAAPDALPALLASRGLHPLGMPEWHRIDAAEIARGQQLGRPRTTLAHRRELLDAAAAPEGGDPGSGRT